VQNTKAEPHYIVE